MAKNLVLGRRGEDFAADYLRRQGYVIVAQNHKIEGLGELDLIARDGGTLVFVEVKTRRGEAFDAVFAVDASKRKKLKRLARAYLAGRRTCRHRFDIIGLTLTPEGLVETVRHIRDAF
ncbi:MAG: YraN family protein [bacterium JZ-2024 1]